MSQHVGTPAAPGTFGSKNQICRPVFASSAYTLLQAVVTYMTPSITSGVDSCPRVVSKSNVHAGFSCETLSALIWFRLEKRCSGQLPP